LGDHLFDFDCLLVGRFSFGWSLNSAPGRLASISALFLDKGVEPVVDKFEDFGLQGFAGVGLRGVDIWGLLFRGFLIVLLASETKSHRVVTVLVATIRAAGWCHDVFVHVGRRLSVTVVVFDFGLAWRERGGSMLLFVARHLVATKVGMDHISITIHIPVAPAAKHDQTRLKVFVPRRVHLFFGKRLAKCFGCSSPVLVIPC
jgi:hypothetical protein